MIAGIWGDDKTCKTTLALTFPKPMLVMELDIGGYERAKYRFQKEVDNGSIKYEMYPLPMQVGNLDLDHTKITVTKNVTGMKELFYKWLGSYINHLKDPKLATIVVDTATLLYNPVICDCYLQELQEGARDGKVRTQLTQIEYREPNNRMRGIIYNAKASGKNLVMVHHSRDEYKTQTRMVNGQLLTESVQTGNKERAGFGTLGDSADIIVHTTWNKEVKKPYADVELCEVKFVEGMQFEEPSYDKLVQAIMMGRGQG